MRQVSIRELRREVSRDKLKAWLPCQVVADGEVVAVLLPPAVPSTFVTGISPYSKEVQVGRKS